MSHSYQLTIGGDAIYKRKPCVILEFCARSTALIQVKNEQRVVPIGHLRPPKGIAKPEPSKDLLDLSQTQRDQASARLHAIRHLLNRARTQAEVKECAEKQKVNRATIYRWLRDFERTGKLQSLVPKKSDGGKNGHRLDPKLERIVSEGIEKRHMTAQRRTATKVYEWIVNKCNLKGIRPLCYNTLKHRINALDKTEEAKARHGAKAVQHTRMTGGSLKADGPGQIAQIDHTPLDCFAVDDELRPIGRPWITLMIDIFSRMVWGYFLSFAPPSAAVVGRCIVNAVLPKDRILSRLGLSKFRWPCSGFHKALHADNGKDFHTQVIDMGAGEYGFDVIWRPVARPNYGGEIENLMGQIAKEMRELQGATFRNLKERAEYDSEGTAIYKVSDLERYIVTWLVGIYANHSSEGYEGRTPLQMLELGYERIGKPPPIELDPEKLDIDFMPVFRRTVNWYGIRIDKLTYNDDILNRYRLVKGEDGKLPLYIVRRDPWLLRKIWFYEAKEKKYYPVTFSDKSLPNITEWELKAARAQLKLQKIENRKITEPIIFEANKELKAIEDSAVARSKRPRRNKARSAMPPGSIASMDESKPEPPLDENVAVYDEAEEESSAWEMEEIPA
jgi:putative transposase